MVNSEDRRTQWRIEDDPAVLGREETCSRVPQRSIAGEPVVFGNGHSDGQAVDLGLPPLDRECQGGVEEGIEVEIGISELPEIFCVHYRALSYPLLETSIELIADPRSEGLCPECAE